MLLQSCGAGQVSIYITVTVTESQLISTLDLEAKDSSWLQTSWCSACFTDHWGGFCHTRPGSPDCLALCVWLLLQACLSQAKATWLTSSADLVTFPRRSWACVKRCWLRTGRWEGKDRNEKIFIFSYLDWNLEPQDGPWQVWCAIAS